MKRSTNPLDVIGFWTEVKLDIIGEYAAAYSRIMAAQTSPRLEHIYIDAFAGAGEHIARSTGETVAGSPLRVLDIQPPFGEYHLIELDPERTHNLRERIGDRPDVFIHEGDCNDVLIDSVFPRAQYKDYRRALCLLDPYGLDLDWRVTQEAGRMGTVDMFLHFPMMDMNRNVLWRNPEGVSETDIKRMDRYWGDNSWREAAYTNEGILFPELSTKASNEAIVEAFRKRLRDVAGFAHVPEPIPMKNSANAVVYYLFFASQKPVAASIIKDIFDKHRDRKA